MSKNRWYLNRNTDMRAKVREIDTSVTQNRPLREMPHHVHRELEDELASVSERKCFVLRDHATRLFAGILG